MYDRDWVGDERMADRFQMTEVKRLADERKLRLTWEDGFSSAVDYETLRGYCPCAGCQGHGTGEIEFRPPANPVEPLSIRPVGNYAISIQWSDGHDTGIYRFDFLRQLASEQLQTDSSQGE
jgi:DUF971 family protein